MMPPVLEDLSCKNKRRFLNGEEAQKAMKSRKGRNSGSYKCQLCDGWHLFTKGKKAKMLLQPKQKKAKISEAVPAPNPWKDRNRGKGLSLPKPEKGTINLGELIKREMDKT